MLCNIKLLSPICNPVCLCVTITTEHVRLKVLLKFNIKPIASLDVMLYLCVGFVYCVTILVTFIDIQSE
jgi:hypothetical protein